MHRKSKSFSGLALVALIAACAPVEPATNATAKSCRVGTLEIGAFIKVPQGRFIKGAKPVYPEEAPSIELHVDEFWIQTHEVTNAQFATFIAETGYITDAEHGVLDNRLGAGSAVFRHPDMRPADAPPWTLSGDASWKAPNGAGSSITGRENEPVVHVSKRDAEAYATGVVAKAIQDNGLEAAQYQVALKQVEALSAVGAGEGKQTVVLPTAVLDAFGDAFKMLKGRA